MPLRFVLSAVRVQLFRVIEFFPSIQTPSDCVETKVAFETVMSAVE